MNFKKQLNIRKLSKILSFIYLGIIPSAFADNVTFYYDGTQVLPNGMIIPQDNGGNSASHNVVTVDFSSGITPTLIVGGKSQTPSGRSGHNTVIINNSSGFIPRVYGMLLAGNQSPSTAHLNYIEANLVLIKNGLYGAIAGARADAAQVIDNTVIMTGGETNTIYGGDGVLPSSNVLNNAVHISGDAVINELVLGGGQTAFSNTGFDSGNVYNNSITITGGTFYLQSSNTAFAGIVGGYSAQAGSANSNTVEIDGAPIIHTVDAIGGNPTYLAGGISFDGDAINNTISISGKPQFLADSFGNNQLVLAGGILGNNTHDGYTGNTLNYSAHPIKVNTVANFENYNFTIDPKYANQSTALISAENIQLGNDNGTKRAQIEVVGIHSGKVLKVNDKFILMRATEPGGFDPNGDGKTTYGVAQQGISLLYDVRTDVDAINQEVTATIIGRVGEVPGTGDEYGIGGGWNAARVNPQLKALSEGVLLSNQLVNRGGDLLAYNTFSAINEQNHHKGWVPFIITSAQRTRYNSGSHVDANEYLITGGITYQQNNLTGAFLIEGGWDKYDTYNYFENAKSVHGHGNSYYYGLALLGRYDFNNGIYTEGALRYGRRHIEFSTDDIKNFVTGESASYKLKTHYISTHAGIGYILPLNEMSYIDLSAKYLYTSTAGKEVKIAGDAIRFDRVTSNRVRLNAEFSHQYSDTVNLYGGLGYEYEFSGKAKAKTYETYSIDAPSLRGGTGIFSFGATIRPESNKQLAVYLRGQGYVGKRQGAGISLRIEYKF